MNPWSSTPPQRGRTGAREGVHGATLVEVVVATVVLGVAIPPLVALYTGVASRSADGAYQAVALAYADSLLEEIASKAFEDPDLYLGSFGTEEGSRAAYDDVDDFDGLVESPPARLAGALLDDYSGFTRSVAVVNVTSADPDPVVPEADGSTDFKRVEVTVSWTGGRGGELTLTTLRSNLERVPTPLDEGASVLTAAKKDGNELKMNLVSAAAWDIEVASFDLSADVATALAKKLKVAGKEIWKVDAGVALPMVGTACNQGNAGDRTIDLGTSPEMLIEWTTNPTGTVRYRLVLYFIDGSRSLLEFSITW